MDQASEDGGERASDGGLVFRCARCGEVAAEIVLLPAGRPDPAVSAGEDPASDFFANEERLRRRGFLGGLTLLRGRAELRSLFATIANRDYRAVHRDESDLLAFHCPECDLAYCDRCWQVEPPVFDDGFYDYTEAVCPAGHRHVVDD
jgi:hypothetical protein